MANYTSVVAANIADVSGNKLANGTISFLGTDANNHPINFQVGGGGQVINRAVTATVTNGVIANGFVVANPANTLPAGIFYQVVIFDNTTQQTVASYSLVSFSGDTFNFDNYMQADTVVVPPIGSTINGPLVVNGNLSVTGTLLSGAPGAGAESKLGTFSIPATIWAVTHNFGTQAVVAQCYDNSWHQIIPDTLTQTDVNTTTATFVQAQTGYMVVVNVGNWTPSVANPNNIIGNPTSSQSIAGDYPFTVAGTINPKRLGSIRIASAFPGADLGARINAADADLGANPGEIWVDQAAGATISTAVSISTNHTLRFVQGGTYTVSQTLTLAGFNSALIGNAPAGEGIGGTNAQTVLIAANAASLSAVVNISTGSQSCIQNVLVDGNTANNGTSASGVAIKITDANRCQIVNCTTQNAKSHGIWVFSTGSTANSCCGRLTTVMSIANGGSGLKLDASPDWIIVGSEFENNGADGITAVNSPTARLSNCDLGGNLNHGINLGGPGGMPWGGSGGWIIVGCQFGNNVQRDLYVNSLGAFLSANHTISANSFVGSSGRADNTWAAITLESSSDNQINGNLFGGGGVHRYKYHIEELNTNTGAGPNVITGNNFNNGGAGTAIYSLLASISTVVAGNREGSIPNGMLRNMYFPNNIAVNWADASGVVRGVLLLDSSNNFYIEGHPTAKYISLQSVPGTNSFELSNNTFKCGINGTALSKLAKYTASLSPALVAANTTAEQTFTVSGVATGDVVIAVNKPTAQAGLGIVGVRTSGTNQVGITFSNNTAGGITPTASETYSFAVLQ